MRQLRNLRIWVPDLIQHGNLRMVLGPLLLVFVLYSCKRESQKIISTFDNGKPEIVRQYPDSKDTTEYLYMRYFENGQLLVKGMIKNNKQEGHWQWWYKNGIVHDSALLKDGKYIGTRKHWYENGVIKEVEYIDPHDDCIANSCNGQLIFYDSLGRIVIVEFLKDGKFDGRVIQYYYNDKNGQIKRYGEYKNDLPWGKRIEWYTDNRRTEGQYLNGKEEGTWHYYKNNKEYSQNEYKNGKVLTIKNLDTLTHQITNSPTH